MSQSDSDVIIFVNGINITARLVQLLVFVFVISDLNDSSHLRKYSSLKKFLV